MNRWTRTALWLLFGLLLVTGSVVAQEPRLSVRTFGVGTAVDEERNLVGQADSFAEGTKVYFWTRVLGGGQEGDRVRHVWFHDDEQVLDFGLSVGSASWRTWSSKILHPGSEGSWRVEVRDAEGTVLAKTEFTCTKG